MIALQEEHSRQRYGERVGRVVEVLVEGPARAPAGHWFGRTPDLKDTVLAPPRPEPAIGASLPVRITAATSHTLRGEPVDRAAAEAH
jgi:tRNA A37 methylthiotransferase MiaB